MAKRPRRFKKVSISFPIDLYTKVAAAVETSPPHSMSSWVVEACRRAVPAVRHTGDIWKDNAEMSGRALQEKVLPGPTVAQAEAYEQRIRIPPRFKYGGGAGCGGHVPKDEPPLEFHSDAFAMVVPLLSPAQAEEFKEVVRDQRAADIATSIPGVQVGISEPSDSDENFQRAKEYLQAITEDQEEFNLEAQATAEFGQKIVTMAAKHVPGWGKWGWAKRLDHLRELKAAAVSG